VNIEVAGFTCFLLLTLLTNADSFFNKKDITIKFNRERNTKLYFSYFYEIYYPFINNIIFFQCIFFFPKAGEEGACVDIVIVENVIEMNILLLFWGIFYFNNISF